MRIEITTTFLDGTDRFEKGDTRTVSDEQGERFVANGWASAAGAQAAPAPAPEGEVSLSIHNSTVGTGDSNG